MGPPTEAEVSKKAKCCGDPCCMADHCREGEPCWGEVEVDDELWWEDDWMWIHACEGHRGVMSGEPYTVEPGKEEG
jgi:hypothetical protein